MRILRLIISSALAVLLSAGCADVAERDVVHQTSTLSALMGGAYDGAVTCGQLKARGDLGIGCFHAMDGEMVVLDGKVYRIRADGKAYAAQDSDTTPFAAVTFFEADQTVSLRDRLDYEQLARRIDSVLPGRNVPYALKITGTFEYVKTRSVPRQSKPYPPLLEVAKRQPTFEFRSVRGTLVGFRLPQYLRGVNMTGYHLHFLTEGCTAGGHVLKLTTREVRIEIDSCSAVHLSLPDTQTFRTAEPAVPSEADLKRTEK